MGVFKLFSSGSDYTDNTIPVGNPIPTRFKIVRYEQRGRNLAAEIEYPDARNYEGRKIIVFRDVNFLWLRAQTTIDPHFTQGSKVFARFAPTPDGWAAALDIATRL